MRKPPNKKRPSSKPRGVPKAMQKKFAQAMRRKSQAEKIEQKRGFRITSEQGEIYPKESIPKLNGIKELRIPGKLFREEYNIKDIRGPLNYLVR